MVHVTKDDGTDFDMEIDDGRSNTLAKAFTDSVPDLSWLPTVAPNGYIVKVESDPSTTLDDRYLKFSTTSRAHLWLRLWNETVKPGIQYKIDENTMPLVIYRESWKLFVAQLMGPTDVDDDLNIVLPLNGHHVQLADEETVPA